jgi:hypothetical protein
MCPKYQQPINPVIAPGFQRLYVDYVVPHRRRCSENGNTIPKRFGDIMRLTRDQETYKAL